MPARTAREAVKSFLASTQQAISCITDAVLEFRRAGKQEPLVITLAGARQASLSGATRLSTEIRIQFHVESDQGHPPLWEVQIVAYAYSLDDAGGREILAYQWHPAGQSHVSFPHLHLGSGAGIKRLDLLGAHLPTGFIRLSTFVRLILTEFEVRPRRPDWVRILGR